jgi:hypothetical protein
MERPEATIPRRTRDSAALGHLLGVPPLHAGDLADEIDADALAHLIPLYVGAAEGLEVTSAYNASVPIDFFIGSSASPGLIGGMTKSLMPHHWHQ